MKKLLSIVLAALLVLAMGTVVLAEETEDPGYMKAGTDSKKASLVYNAGGEDTAVISVDVQWADLTYEYTGTNVWDADKMEYVNTDPGISQVNSGDIVVINKSNVPVYVTCSVTVDKLADTIDATVDLGGTYKASQTERLGAPYKNDEGEMVAEETGFAVIFSLKENKTLIQTEIEDFGEDFATITLKIEQAS